MSLPSPLSLLEHDHAQLTRQIAALHAEVTALREVGAPAEPMADDLVQALVALSEELFEHFAREEEGLFPFVVERAPDLAPDVAVLVEGHDRICGAASRLLALRDRAPTPGTLDLAASLFQRLVDVYAEHSGRELALLAALAPRLDAAAQAEFAVFIAGTDPPSKHST
ncbi:MAG: hemerythrin domain-containing protein [Minicystis sp.]